MDKNQLIADQQIHIENLKDAIVIKNKALENISKLLCCIGGPLNDNSLQYNKMQVKIFFEIERYCEAGTDA